MSEEKRRSVEGEISPSKPSNRKSRAVRREHAGESTPEARINREIRAMKSGKTPDVSAPAEKTEKKPSHSGRENAAEGRSRNHDDRNHSKHANRRSNNDDSVIRDPRELVVRGLMRLDERGYSNIICDNLMRRSHLNELDKVLATRIYYGTLSNLRLIDAVWARFEPDMPRRADDVVHMTLRSALYQLMFLDRVPAYSVVSSSVEVVKRLRSQGASGYCNALLRKIVKIKEKEGKLDYVPIGSPVHDFAIRYSLNDDLATLLCTSFGDDAVSIAESMMRAPSMNLRVNLSKISMEDFLNIPDLMVERSKLLPECSCIVQSRNAALETVIASGLCCVQDEAAQLAVHALGEPEKWGIWPDHAHVWDACAGQGGKTLHILDILSRTRGTRKYDLLSSDLYASKLERLKSAQRDLFPDRKLIVKVRDLTQPGSVPLAPFDAVLVDAPCSGLGVMRRHPEVKLLRKANDIESLAQLQHAILDNVSKHIRVGGTLIYAVCTITQQECENQREIFLKEHPNYEPAPLCLESLGERGMASALKLLPSVDGCDGFYISKFIRRE